MLTELIQAATIIDSVVSERMKVYEASFKFEVKNAPEYGYFLDIINSVSQRDKIKIVLQDETEQVYDVCHGVQLRITDAIDDFDETIKAYRDNDGNRYIQIKTDNDLTFRRFSNK